MKQAFQTFAEFTIVSMMTFGMIYIEVFVYLLITLKDYAVQLICGC